MAYEKTNWVNGVTPLNASNMNKIEQGIYDNSIKENAFYKHVLTLEWEGEATPFTFITNSSTPITDVDVLSSQVIIAGCCDCDWRGEDVRYKMLVNYWVSAASEEFGYVAGLIFADADFEDSVLLPFDSGKVNNFGTDTVTVFPS